DNKDLHLRISWYDTTLNILHTRRKSVKFYSAGFIDNEVNKIVLRYDNITLQQKVNWSDSLFSQLRLGYRVADTDFALRVSPALVITSLKLKTTEYFLALHNQWEIDDYNDLQFGIEVRRPELRQAELVFDALTPAPTSLIKQEVYGFYSQFQHEFNANTVLTLGMRYDRYSDIGSNLSLRFAVVHQINEKHTIKVLYGEAFRAPAFNELVSSNVLFGSLDLKPETVRTTEIIWQSQWAEALINVSLFNNDIEDSIVQEVIGTTRTFVNHSRQSIYGSEVEVIAPLSENWYLRSGYSYFFKKPGSSFRESDSLFFSAVNFKSGKWNANVAINYMGEKQRLNSNGPSPATLNSFWLVNTKVSYALSKKIKASIQVKNLFDERYQTPGIPELKEGIHNRGREFIFAVDLEF
ncbi:MAG: TonB-dependent receptor, partial [Lentisphaeraceae bacterium]|nr:TonB-dependent receptor [Lentisphaeraceae bacterium]